jgi:putative transposase
MIAGMGLRFAYVMTRRLVGGLALLSRSDAAKEVEILVLRHQLALMQRQVGRPRLTWSDRAVIAVLALRLPPARRVGMIVTPGTILRGGTVVWSRDGGRPRLVLLAGLRSRPGCGV